MVTNLSAGDDIMGNDKGYQVSTLEKQAEFAKKRCWCHTCNPIDYTKPESVYMRLCPECGNKRCPRATDHNNTCTNSNEPNQTGSNYHYTNTDNPVDFPEWDSWKPIKDL